MVNSYDIKIVQNALAMAKQVAISNKEKGSEQTPKLIAIKTINRMKEYRNKIKTPNLKKEFEKAISKLEKDYKKMKEGKIKESGILYKAGVKKYGKEGMKKITRAAGKKKSHAAIGAIKDKYEKDKKEGVREAKESAIDVARRIVKNHQHEQGVDAQTANLIMKIYNAYDKHPALQKKFEKLPLKKMAQMVWKFVK